MCNHLVIISSVPSLACSAVYLLLKKVKVGYCEAVEAEILVALVREK